MLKLVLIHSHCRRFSDKNHASTLQGQQQLILVEFHEKEILDEFLDSIEDETQLKNFKCYLYVIIIMDDKYFQWPNRYTLDSMKILYKKSHCAFINVKLNKGYFHEKL